MLHIENRGIRTLPREWREHPELRDGYDAAANQSMLGMFRSPTKAFIGWLGSLVITFAVLSSADFTLGFQLTYAGALALWWTVGAKLANDAGTAVLSEQHRLAIPVGRHALQSARWTAGFFVWLGFLGTACFAGGLLALPFR